MAEYEGDVTEYIRELLNEKMNMGHKYPHAEKLLDAEIAKVQKSSRISQHQNQKSKIHGDSQETYWDSQETYWDSDSVDSESKAKATIEGENATFYSTSMDDDVVEPVQCETYQSGSKKSKNSSPSNKGHGSNLKTIEKSRTVLNKTEVKVSSRWRKKIPPKTNVPHAIHYKHNRYERNDSPENFWLPTIPDTEES